MKTPLNHLLICAGLLGFHAYAATAGADRQPVSARAGTAQAAAILTVQGESGVLVVQSSGAGGRQVGIPTWKAVLRRDDAGNISALHVPADHPA